MSNLVPRRGFRAPDRPGSTSPFLALQQEMNRLFDNAFAGWNLAPFGQDIGWPSVEVSENNAEVKVTVELPGLDEKDIEVHIDDNVLTITGEKRAEADDKQRQYSEHYYGRFERRLSLPAVVDDERVKASFKNGLLTVTMPKVEGAKAKTKRIPIG